MISLSSSDINGLYAQFKQLKKSLLIISNKLKDRRDNPTDIDLDVMNRLMQNYNIAIKNLYALKEDIGFSLDFLLIAERDIPSDDLIKLNASFNF